MKTSASLTLSILSLVLFATAARADTLSGRVVDASGVGIAGVDLDVKNLGSGGDPPITGDTTDALGFFTTTMPAGEYRVSFNPPPPPASTSLIFEIDDLMVSGNLNLGVLSAPQGVGFSGRLLRAGGLPVAGVNLDVIDVATGTNLDLIGDTSSPTGHFAVAVPIGEVEVRFDTSPVIAPLLAPTKLEFSTQAGVDIDVGDLELAPGLRITALIRRPNGTPLPDTDTDTEDSIGGDTLYTPKDNTSATGVVSVVVPAGTYDFRVCPLLGTNLVAHEVSNLVVAANVNLGLITLQAGVRLSGTVTGSSGVISGVDLDVRDATTLAKIALCDDNSNVAGAYAVNVPPGSYVATFTPPYSKPFGTTAVAVVVAANTALNAVLPDCPFSTSYGSGLAGAGGLTPLLGSQGGAPRLGNPDWAVTLSNGRGGAKPYVVLGLGQTAAAFKQGTWLVDIFTLPGKVILGLPPLSGPLGVPGAGALTIPAPISEDPLLSGLSVYLQLLVVDDQAPAGFAMSAGLRTTFCD